MPPGIFLAALFLVFGGAAFVGVSFSPIGRALGDRLRGRHTQPEAFVEIDDLKAEVGMLKQQLNELAERQDFAERMLVQARERGLLGAPAPGERAP